VARSGAPIDFDGPAAWIYLAFLATVLLGALAVLVLQRKQSDA
jgi:hypothetical protein